MSRNILHIWPILDDYDKYWLDQWSHNAIGHIYKVTPFSSYDDVLKILDYVINFTNDSYETKSVSRKWSLKLKTKICQKHDKQRGDGDGG